MAFQPDPAYLAKYKQTFGAPWAGVRRDIVSYVDTGDGGTVNPTGNQYRGGPPIIKLPGPVPTPVPVTPVTPVTPSPPVISIPGRHHKPWEGRHVHPLPPVHSGRGWRDRDDGRHRRRHSFGPRPAPPPYRLPGPPPPVPVTPPEVAPPVAATGKICPTWGYMVSTNPDGSETVHQCQPGSVAAAGLHGLDGLFDDITAPIAGVLGPNWMLYAGAAALAYFFFFKKGRR